MARLVLLLVACLLAQAFAVPARNRRPIRHDADAEVKPSASASEGANDDIDDDDDFEDMHAAPSTSGGSNIMSLLNLATALFPSASGANLEAMIRRTVREYFTRNPLMLRRKDIADNVIEIDYINELTPPLQRQETEENGDTNESDENNGNNSSGEDDSGEDDNAAEESVEENTNGNDKASKQDSGLNGDDEDSDYSDEPPGGGDGQGGGVLGLLAGLSGGEDGESDLGSLLAAVSGIVGSLSGDGFDLNALLATGFGLFVGLLSQGEENPGQIIASYLLTSLDTITGGGSQNNGAFIGNFLSKLIKGTSMAPDEDGSSSDENGNKMPMTDSAGFFASPQSETDSNATQIVTAQVQSPLWTLKMDILRSFLRFATTILGLASTSFITASTV